VEVTRFFESPKDVVAGDSHRPSASSSPRIRRAGRRISIPIAGLLRSRREGAVASNDDDVVRETVRHDDGEGRDAPAVRQTNTAPRAR